MNSLETCEEALTMLCREFNVTRLELFGSAVREGSFTEKSDLDFLVRFAPNAELGPWMSQYFELAKRLERLFGRKVDLVIEGPQLKERFLRSIESDRHLIYGA